MANSELFKYSFGCAPEMFPETVILSPVFSTKRMNVFLRGAVSFKGHIYSCSVGESRGRKVAVIFTGMGSSFAGDAVIMMKRTSVENIIFTGVCGGMNDCAVGDILIPERAFNGEGFSRYYRGGSDICTVLEEDVSIPADKAYTAKIRSFFGKKTRGGTKILLGDVFTIGSLTVQSGKDIEKVAKAGFRGVDMELSAVFNASRAIGRRSAGALIVSDLPLEKAFWKGLAPDQKKIYQKRIDEVLENTILFAAETN